MNLTWETLEGLVKHNGPLINADGSMTARYKKRGIPVAIKEFAYANALEPHAGLMPKNLGPDQWAPVIALAIADKDLYVLSFQIKPSSITST